MPKIKSVTVRAVRVPMLHPHRTAGGVVSESPLVLTDILGDDGSVGHSIVFTYTVAALAPTAGLVRNIGNLICGEEFAPQEIEQLLSRRFRLLGPQGLTGIGMAAIDMALWDGLARRHETSLVGLLGGVAKPIPAYGAVGFDGPELSASGAAEWAERGFKGVKAKIGYPTVQEDLAVIRSIRKSVGDDVSIMVDYNQSLLPTEAIQRLRILDGEGLAWIEEPTLAHDYSGHAQIVREIQTPIQCGENWWGTTDLKHAIAAKASDYLMPDVMKIGGVTGWLRASALAHAEGLRVSNHLWPEISVQLLCVTPTAHWLEYADWWNPILLDPLVIENGIARIDATIGTGIEWNEASVLKYLVPS